MFQVFLFGCGSFQSNPSLLSVLIQVLRLNKHFERRVLLKYRKERTFCSTYSYTGVFENECVFHADTVSELEACFLGDFICCAHKSKLRQENSAAEFVEDMVELVERRFVGQVATGASGFTACLCLVSRLWRRGHARPF
jgi:hypothetical protein